MWGRISALADAVEGRAGCATRPPRSLRTFPVSRASRPCLLAENTAETAVIRINSQAPWRTRSRTSPSAQRVRQGGPYESDVIFFGTHIVAIAQHAHPI